MKRPDLLVIMAKYPTPGRVKTRLAREIGPHLAAELYRSFLLRFATEFAEAEFDVEWRYTPAQTAFRRVIGNEFMIRPQPEGNLGRRIRQIFDESFACGYGRVIVIGTDAPEVDRKTVRRALGLLRRHRAVFQPTVDGGYALVGLAQHNKGNVDKRRRRQVPDIFTGIDWSTDRVMSQTRKRLAALGLTFAELPSTYDVDTSADLARLKR